MLHPHTIPLKYFIILYHKCISPPILFFPPNVYTECLGLKLTKIKKNKIQTKGGILINIDPKKNKKIKIKHV